MGVFIGVFSLNVFVSSSYIILTLRLWNIFSYNIWNKEKNSAYHSLYCETNRLYNGDIRDFILFTFLVLFLPNLENCQ